MVSFFGRKKKDKKKLSGLDDLQSPTRQDQKPGDGSYFGPGMNGIHDIHDIDLPLPPRSGSAMSSRSQAARTPPFAPSYKTKGGAPQIDVNVTRYDSQPSSAGGSYHNTPSPSLRSPASNESPWGSRPGTPSGRSKGLVIPEPQPRRDHFAPKSPLAQSQNMDGHRFGEPSPLSDWQPGNSNGVSPMSSHFSGEEHATPRGYLPSPPGSSTRPEFNKPSRENLNPHGAAYRGVPSPPGSSTRPEFNKPSRENLNPHGATYRGPPAGSTVRVVNPDEPRNSPSAPPAHAGPAPLPSPALSGMAGQGEDESDDETWNLPVVRTVGAHRDTLTRMGPRQTSITANIEGPGKSPLADFKFSDDDEKALSKAHRSSSPIEFGEMNRAHKPLPLVLQKQPSEQIPEDRVPGERVPERVASPLASPPANRAAAGMGICGNWPLGSREMPGGMAGLPPQGGFSPGEEPRNRRMGPPAEPEGRSGPRGPMPESRGPPVQGDMRDLRGPPPEATRSPEGRRHGPMGPGHPQPDPPSVPSFMRPGPPPGTYSGPPPGPPSGPPPEAQPRSPPGPYSGLPPGPPGSYPRSPPEHYSRPPQGGHPSSPPGARSRPPPGTHRDPQHPPGNMSPSSYRGPPGPGRPPMHGPGPDSRPNYGAGSGPGPGPAPGAGPSHPWARPQGAAPPPRGPTGTPGPRGPLKPTKEARPRPPGPGAPMGPSLGGMRPENEFPLPPGHGGPGSPMRPPPENMRPRNEFPQPPGHGGPGSAMGPSPGGMRPPIEPPLPPGTPGLDAVMKHPPIRTRNGTPAPKSAPKPRKQEPLPPPPRGMTPTLRGPPPTAPPPNRPPSPPRAMAKYPPENQVRPQQSAPELDFAFNFPPAPKAPQSEPSPPKFTNPRPAPPSPAPGAARPAHFDNPNWPLAAPLPKPAMSPPPNKALPPPPHSTSPRAWDGVAESEWPGPRRNPMTPASPAGWGPMVR